MPHIRLNNKYDEIIASTSVYIPHPLATQTFHLPPPPQWIQLPNIPTAVNVISPLSQTLYLPPPPQ